MPNIFILSDNWIKGSKLKKVMSLSSTQPSVLSIQYSERSSTSTKSV